MLVSLSQLTPLRRLGKARHWLFQRAPFRRRHALGGFALLLLLLGWAFAWHQEALFAQIAERPSANISPGMAASLAARVAIQQHGPVLLMALATVAALAVSAAWARQLQRNTAAEHALAAHQRNEQQRLEQQLTLCTAELRRSNGALQQEIVQRQQVNRALQQEIAQRRHAEQELRRALSAAETANQAKSAFLTSMSHELRTPLNAIIGYTELLQLDAEEQGYAQALPDLRQILHASDHLLSLINDVLDVAKIEAGKMELNLQCFSVARLVDELATTALPLMQRQRNQLLVHCPPSIGVMYADQRRVRQVLLNLLSNAAKFTDGGTIALSVEHRAAQAGVREQIVFRVHDNGIGIAPEQCKRVFEPFTQIEAAARTGSGLGLAICSNFCYLMGGAIQVESVLGKGSTFTVRLPVTMLPLHVSLSSPKAA